MITPQSFPADDLNAWNHTIVEMGVRIVRPTTSAPRLETYIRSQRGIVVTDNYTMCDGVWSVSQIEMALSTVRDCLMSRLSMTDGVQLVLPPSD